MKDKDKAISDFENLHQRIQRKDSIIGVIGLGYVGLPLVIRFFEKGFKTIGFDIDIEKVDLLNNGKSYISHIKQSDIINMANKGFLATSDFSQIKNLDVIIICVPTPLGDKKEPDLSYIKNTLFTLEPFLRKAQLLILESTTYPGTTEEEIFPLIEKLGFNVGKDFFIGYSPEREDPGNKNFSTKTIPKVISGHTNNCLELVKTLYDKVIDKTVPVSSTKTAEMTKILENIYRAVNIGLVNELKMVADKMDIDIYEVINAAKTKPFGFTPFYPGPGLGGHCIPIDPFYLTWKAKQIGMDTHFIELAGKINTEIPNYVIKKLIKELGKEGKTIKRSDILVLGLAYKKNVDDTRESPSLLIIDMLMKKGAKVQYSDPHIPRAPKTRKFNFNLKNIKINIKNIKGFDAILLLTDHDDFDYNLIEKHAQLIIDTRGVFKKSKKIVNA